MYPDLSLDKSVHTPYLSATPQVRPTFRLAWEVINDRLRIGSIGISPLPGTPPAAHFCYGSIIVPCVCHRPPRVVTPLHSRYRVDRSLPREITAHLLSLACPLIAYNAGNVPDEWVFSCQSSQGGYLPLQVVASENARFLRLSRKFFQIFFDSPHSLCDG